MAGKTVDVTESTWEQEVEKSSVPVLVDFWAEWCGPCRAIGPTLEQLADDYDGRLKVAKVDVDGNRGLAQKFGVRSIPFLLIMKDGEVVENMVGALGKPEFVSKIDPHL